VTALAPPSAERLTRLFLDLAGRPSPSGAERLVADFIIDVLESLGISVSEDTTGAEIGGDTGNLCCTVQGNTPYPCLALGAHMDTVLPTAPLEPFLDEEGVFRNRRSTILGADDKAAIAALLHAVELLKASQEFPTFELFFTVSEEIGLVGAKHLGEHLLRSPFAAVLDSSGPVGGIMVKAPSQQALKVVFRGRAAHAGVEPERGRSAILASAGAISSMRLGRIDEETTANIGVIRGGTAPNIVPDICEIMGECRSHDEGKLAKIAAEMVDAVQEAATQTGVDVDTSLVQEYRSFALSPRAAIVRLSRAAVRSIGLEPRLLTGGGGSDANILNARGLPTVNLDAGMLQVHSPDEHLALEDLTQLCALVAQMILLSPQFVPKSVGAAASHV